MSIWNHPAFHASFDDVWPWLALFVVGFVSLMIVLGLVCEGIKWVRGGNQ